MRFIKEMKHLPLGNDCLKAHGILVRVAQKYGGVVVPPTYWSYLGKWHPWTMIDFDEEIVEPLYRKIFQGLIDVGFKVVIGITGHNVAKQREAIQKAVYWIRQYSEGHATGYAMWEVDLTRGPESDTDHAAKWETSNLLYMRPDWWIYNASRTRT